MLVEKLKNKTILGLAALVIGGGFSCADECEKLNYEKPRAGGTYISPEYNQTTLGLFECPPGCDYIGETEDQYCCWCPD